MAEMDAKRKLLVKAVRKGNVGLVRTIFDSLECVNAARDDDTLVAKLEQIGAPINKSGDTVLHLACRHGHREVINVILDSLSIVSKSSCAIAARENVMVNHQNAVGHTPLHESALAGDAISILALVAAGADVHKVKQADWTALHLAATRDVPEAIAALLESGADASRQNRDGRTPFHIACAAGGAKVLRLLLDHAPRSHLGASTNGQTALMRAALYGNMAALDMLIRPSLPPPPRLSSSPSSIPSQAVLAAQAENAPAPAAVPMLSATATDSSGQTALHWAVGGGHKAAICALLDCGADINARDKAGRTPLHMAAATGDTGEHFSTNRAEAEDIARHLISHARGDARNVDPFEGDGSGSTPLHLAAIEGHYTLASIFLHEGAAVDAVDAHGRTALHAAALRGRGAVVKVLLEAGADPTRPDANGKTPREFARGEAVKLLCPQL